MDSHGTLKGRRALVTGAGSGNGAAIALRLCREGAATTLLDRNPDGLEAVLASWSDEERRLATPVVADITVESDLARVFEGIDALDILVNNAGIVEGTPFPELDVETFSRVLDVNLLGAYRCARSAFDLLGASRAGRMINLTSMEAHFLLATGAHVQPHYNASKAALDLLTKALAFEFAKSGVTVNAIAPGIIATPFTSQALQQGEVAGWIRGSIPLDRVGRPEDVAAVAAFLASDDAEYVTGASIPVDGGLTTGWFRQAPSPGGDGQSA